MIRLLVAITSLVLLTAVPAGTADAAPGTAGGLVITGVQPSPGAVEFFVSGRHLPAATSLADVGLTVLAGGATLPSTARPVTRTAPTTPAGVAVLVLDTSRSMAGDRLAAARTAAADYAAAAPAGLRLGLVTVADQPTVALAPTADRAAFAAAVSRLTASGRTALYDGIRAAEDVLDERLNPAAAGLLDRHIVVLSDGADTSSRLTGDELLRRVAGADATIDAVAFGGDADREHLGDLAAATGGRVLSADDAPALRSAFQTMAGVLSPPVVVRATVPPTLAGGAAVLRVQARLGGDLVSTEAPVVFAADPTAVGTQLPFRFPGSRSPGLAPTLAVVLVALFGVAMLAARPLLARGRLQRRVRELDRFAPAGHAGASRRQAEGNGIVRAAIAVAERAVREPDRRRRLELALDRAGSALKPAEWQLVRIGCAFTAGLTLLLVLPWWCGAVAGLLGGWWGAGCYLRLRATRRARAFAARLPDALRLLVGSLRSGFSLAQSLDAVARDGADPVAGELARALAETRLGGDLETALERVGERTASSDMSWLVMAIRIQRDVGGNLSEVLETAVGTMRERERLHRHVRALSAEGRLSALILFGMPIVLGAWMFVFRREYLRPLYTEPLGLLMLTGSVIGVVVGGIWLRKLVRVEV